MRSAEYVRAALKKHAEDMLDIYMDAAPEEKVKYRRYVAILNDETICSFKDCFADHCEMRAELATLIDDDFQENGKYDAEIDDGSVSWEIGDESNFLRIMEKDE